jgi:DNA-binding LacI/PurR family transcriptional regulator
LSVTIRDVAKRAGVGIGTVSSVINNSRPVSDATRRRVLAAIEELNFVPHFRPRRFSRDKVRMIAVVIPFFIRVAQFERLRGVMSVIAKSEYEITLLVTEPTADRNKVLETVPHQGGIDGLLIFSFVPTEIEIQQILRHKTPTVLVGAYHPELPSIVLNDALATETAVRYLIDLGHRKIAYVYEHREEPSGFPSTGARYQSYCQALKSAGLALNPDYQYQASSNFEQGQQVALDLLTLPDPPTAIFSHSDKLALGIIRAARKLKVEIPDNVSILSYEDTELAQAAQITAVRQHLFESGVQGVKVLLNQIDNQDSSPTCFQLPVELVIRQTTARSQI